MNNHTKDAKTIYYEVMRLRSGALLFLEEHIARLLKSLSLAGYGDLLTAAAIRRAILDYIAEQGIRAANLRVAVTIGDAQPIAVSYFAGSYPSAATYQSGVAVETVEFERAEPNIKRQSTALFELRAALAERPIHDYLLVDKNGYVSEGSKTNLFLVSGHTVYTAPLKNVLGGITRALAIDCIPTYCKLTERALRRDQLAQCDAAFLTGTSIDILPICRIDDGAFNSSDNSVVKDMIQHFSQKVNDYIAANQIQLGAPK